MGLRLRIILQRGDFFHGVVEGPAEDFHEEVDCVAGEVAFWPAPVAVNSQVARNFKIECFSAA